ncbi:hypothetical protein LG290_05050 [Halomonas sediminis]
MTWNVFVVGYDDLGKELLPKLRHVEDYHFRGLLPLDEVAHAAEYDFDQLVADARRELEDFSGVVDAIVGYWDFPTSALLPVLRENLGLPGPSLEAVLKCEHKYWSRLEQSRAVPDCVPPFQAVDPFDENAVDTIEIDYPFWIKPVKAHSSYLGFLIENAEQLESVLPTIRKGIGNFGKPLNQVMKYLDLPDDIAPVTGNQCIAEGIISAGWQCTLEGFVQNGEIQVTGMIDSVRKGHRSVLLRYEYPSALPDDVQQRIIDYARRVMTQIGYDNAPFNIEFYHDQENDKLWLLEINSRLSRSHAAIFQLVDGAPHFQVMVDLGVGITPRMPRGEGRYPLAAKQMLRVFEDGIVRRVPSEEEIQRVKQAFPGTIFYLNVREGVRLSELFHQDSYSYELGVLFIGAENRDDLEERIEQCRDMLTFDIEPL